MEVNNEKQIMELPVNEEGHTYVFDTKEKMGIRPVSKFRRKIWQIVPAMCATFLCIPYGIMLGWPSPTYPTLTKRDSPLWISWDQSAMIAGFLMIGNTVSTPFSSLRVMGAKYGIITGATFMTVGWIVMWQSQNILWLLGSRILVGIGHGFGMGQLKYYISEICQDSLSKTLIKQINLYTIGGVILAFAFGPFVDFRQFSIIATIISILVLFLAIFLPSTPRELIKSGKNSDAQKLVAFLSPHLDITEEMSNLKDKINSVDNSLSFFDVIRDSSLRKNFTIFAFLVFFQQVSGAPATIIYTETLFRISHCPRPELCALLYIFTFFLANIYGIFCIPSHNKKSLLIFSTVGVSLLLILKLIVIVEKVNQRYWPFASLVVMLFFIVVHSVGLGSVPVSLVPDLFPKQATKVVVHFFVMWHSMLALIITKIFQVMFVNIGLFAPICLFLVISTFSVIFVIIFVPNQQKTTEST